MTHQPFGRADDHGALDRREHSMPRKTLEEKPPRGRSRHGPILVEWELGISLLLQRCLSCAGLV
jgi:hypothetical protein